MMKFYMISLAVSSVCAAVDIPSQQPLEASLDDTQKLVVQSSQLTTQIPDSQADPSKSGSWNGWGANVYNNRWASSDAVVDTNNIHGLKQVCSVDYNPGESASPLVEDGVAYYPTWSGNLVALDYATCTELWTTNISSIIQAFRPINETETLGILARVSRTTPVSSDDGDVLFVGTLAHALVLAIDKESGTLIDSLQLDDHPFAAITQSPTFYRGRLYIGVSSYESTVPSRLADYDLSFIGSMTAVTLTRGRLRLAWRTLMGPVDGGFNGAAVWGSQPSIDAFRGQLFIGTGQTYKLPAAFEECQKATSVIDVIEEGHTAEDPCTPRDLWSTSVLALDLDTGRINWARQLGRLDAWNTACVDLPGLPARPEACPSPTGNDTDFGMAPTFVTGSAYTPGGADVVVVGQKNGFLYAFSAQAGEVLWAIEAGPGGLEGGLRWGIAVDNRAVYFTSTNTMRTPHTMPDGTVITHSSFGAADLRDGSLLWMTPASEERVSFMAPTVVNGIVLTGTTGRSTGNIGSVDPPGTLVALDKLTGTVLREETLDGHFQGGIAVVHDYVIFGTGYAGLSVPKAGSVQVWKIEG